MQYFRWNVVSAVDLKRLGYCHCVVLLSKTLYDTYIHTFTIKVSLPTQEQYKWVSAHC